MHPSTRKFYGVIGEIIDLHRKKSQDYGTDEDPFANIRASEEFGIEPWVGALLRANDKSKRLKKFVKHGKLANESVEDSLMDNIVYYIIALVLFRESQLEGTDH